MSKDVFFKYFKQFIGKLLKIKTEIGLFQSDIYKLINKTMRSKRKFLF